MAARRSSCQGKAMSGKDEKAERLAAALRDNLRRRKAQARIKGSIPAKGTHQSTTLMEPKAEGLAGEADKR